MFLHHSHSREPSVQLHRLLCGVEVIVEDGEDGASVVHNDIGKRLDCAETHTASVAKEASRTEPLPYRTSIRVFSGRICSSISGQSMSLRVIRTAPAATSE
jgi:hypothetical protein